MASGSISGSGESSGRRLVVEVRLVYLRFVATGGGDDGTFALSSE